MQCRDRHLCRDCVNSECRGLSLNADRPAQDHTRTHEKTCIARPQIILGLSFWTLRGYIVGRLDGSGYISKWLDGSSLVTFKTSRFGRLTGETAVPIISRVFRTTGTFVRRAICSYVSIKRPRTSSPRPPREPSDFTNGSAMAGPSCFPIPKTSLPCALPNPAIWRACNRNLRNATARSSA